MINSGKEWDWMDSNNTNSDSKEIMEKVKQDIYRGEISPSNQTLKYPKMGTVCMLRIQSGHNISKNPSKEPIFMDKPLSEYISPYQLQCTIVDIPFSKEVEKGEKLPFSGSYDELYIVTLFYSQTNKNKDE